MGVLGGVGVFLGCVLYFKSLCTKIENNHIIEFLWTAIPLFAIFLISIPSFLVAYSSDDSPSDSSLLLVKGMQWDWEFGFSSDEWKTSPPQQTFFDTYSLRMVRDGEKILRCMETQNCLFLGKRKPVLFQVSSEDVIHSFTIPSLGFKIDCIPGKSAEVRVVITKSGIFHGHCAEICGAYHSIMPIELISF